ncbi:MAG: hypothetical protein K1X35_13300 [Caulobacteraceae bacterium]|nr:hypothetical protein [Caulobacteraceae bacterium]
MLNASDPGLAGRRRLLLLLALALLVVLVGAGLTVCLAHGTDAVLGGVALSVAAAAVACGFAFRPFDGVARRWAARVEDERRKGRAA